MDPYKRLAVAVLENAVTEYRRAHEEYSTESALVTDERRAEMLDRMECIEAELSWRSNPWADYSGLDGRMICEALKRRLGII